MYVKFVEAHLKIPSVGGQTLWGSGGGSGVRTELGVTRTSNSVTARSLRSLGICYVYYRCFLSTRRRRFVCIRSRIVGETFLGQLARELATV
jgi:hypothetical protein